MPRIRQFDYKEYIQRMMRSDTSSSVIDPIFLEKEIDILMEKEAIFAEYLQKIKENPDIPYTKVCQWVLTGIYVYDSALQTFQMRANLFFDIVQEHGDVIRMKDSKEKVNAYIKTLRAVHEHNLKIFEKYIPVARKGWWVERNEKEQVISDIAKMLHDLAVIYSNIINEIIESAHPVLKDFIDKINTERKDYIELYTTSNILNIQAWTGHSVKIDLDENRIYGHIGDHYPVEYIDIFFKREYSISKNPEKFRELAQVIADAVTQEQQMRDKIVYLENAIENIISNLPTHMDESYKNPFILIQVVGRERFNNIVQNMKRAKELVNELEQMWNNYAMPTAMKLSSYVVGTLPIQNQHWISTLPERIHSNIVQLFINNDLSIDLVYDIYITLYPWEK